MAKSRPARKLAAAASPTLTLSASRDIPLDRLMLSDANVRRMLSDKAEAGSSRRGGTEHQNDRASIEELAEDIARRTLLQSLVVRPVRDASGAETGLYEIPAGGRRFRALQLLVQQKRLAPDAPIPCIVREAGLAEEDSLAENVQRAPLHPLDQFRAFRALREKGRSEEEIAAAFFVAPAVVKQRLKLAAVAPGLLDLYADDRMTLEQLMAFTVTQDHRRQMDVWDSLKSGWTREPYHIRRLLTEGAVRASEKRARFVGVEAFEAAGGVVLRDLFSESDEAWLEDAALLGRLVADKLDAAAAELRAEGWAWVEAAVDFPYGHSFGLRRLAGAPTPLDDEERAACEAHKAELAMLEAAHADDDELPEDIDARLGELETAIDAVDNRPMLYPAEDIARAGVFISLDPAGVLRIERGFVRPEDEAATTEAPPLEDGTGAIAFDAGAFGSPSGASTGDADHDENANGPLLPDRLMIELTEWRTVALCDALARRPDIAFLAMLHRLCLARFYNRAEASCLEIEARAIALRSGAPGLADCAAARAIEDRRARFAATLPAEPAALWAALVAMSAATREALFAHCVADSIDAVFRPYARRSPAIAHADALASALGLDLAAAGWRTSAEAYFARLPKAAILAAVAEAKGADAAARLASLRKPDMAAAAEALLLHSGWLPAALRTTPPSAEDATDQPVGDDDPGTADGAAGSDADAHATDAPSAVAAIAAA